MVSPMVLEDEPFFLFIILLALHSNGYTIANIANYRVCTLKHINKVNVN